MRRLLLVSLLPLLLAAKSTTRVSPDEYLRSAAMRLLGEALTSDVGWDRLTYLCDRIGPRLSGSEALERAQAWSASQLAADGLVTHVEPVVVPRWIRGSAALTQLSPLPRSIPVLALGGSPGTRGVEGEALVVSSFEELQRKAGHARGRIVVWDAPFTTYRETREFRSRGPREASRVGAIASLVRSVTPTSLATPHTGATGWGDATPIPAAAIPTEDAAALHRLQAVGEPARLQLQLGCEDGGTARSGNVIAEVRGRVEPESIVLLACHMDSWDVGQGAQDDGVGCAWAMEAGRLIAGLPTAPRRTVRVVLFTNEENGGAGADAYRKEHAQEPHTAALEMDSGAGAARGWKLALPAGADADKARHALRGLTALLAPLGAGALDAGDAGADVDDLVAAGVLGLGLDTDTTGYWPVHHTAADTLDKIDPAAFRRNAAIVTLTTFWLAEAPGLGTVTPGAPR